MTDLDVYEIKGKTVKILLVFFFTLPVARDLSMAVALSLISNILY